MGWSWPLGYSSLNSDKSLAVADLPCLVNLGTFIARYIVWDSTCVFLIPRIPGGTEITELPFSQAVWHLRKCAFWCWALLTMLPLLQVEDVPLPPLSEAGLEPPGKTVSSYMMSPSLLARLGCEQPWTHPKNEIYPQKIKIVTFEGLPKNLQKGLTWDPNEEFQALLVLAALLG